MVKRKLYIVLVLAAVSALLLWSVALGEDLPGKKTQRSLGKVAGEPQYQILNINNITTWVRSDGESNHSPSGDNGVYYPVGTGNVVYEDALVFGGKLFTNAALTTRPTVQPVRIEGSTYLGNGYIGTKAGYITGFGASAVAADANAADVRCYRIRRDYYFMSDAELTYDAQTSNELLSPTAVTQSERDAIKQQYDTDWKAWASIVPKGAPYVERNGIPGFQAPPPFSDSFTPEDLITGKYDEPGVAGADPNSPADQVIWLAYNDLDAAQSIRFEGCQPIGVEVQKTVWGYKRSDALGNIYFNRYRLINKGGVDVGGGTRGSFWVDSAYVCQWSDIDLGYATDDLVGSDSTLSLEYVYNGNPVDATFARFGLPPPCSGYAFLAGPEVVSAPDSAVFNFQRIYGKKNLPMSSCVYFSAGSPYQDPPAGPSSYNSGTFEWYGMLQGFAPLGSFGDPYSRYAVPPGVDPNTKYMFSGDPVNRTGFLDGLGTNYSFVPGDRRILLNSGPFKMAPGDTNEVYVGFVVGLGADRLSSISVMKFNYRFVSNTFNALFQVPKPPTSPTVSIAELNEKVVLDWGSDASINAVENKISNPGGYRFEGYNVYQLQSANSSVKDPTTKRLATFDTPIDPTVITDLQPISGVVVAVPVQFGSNSGIKRQFTFTTDKIKDVAKIYNGQEYYLAVTAYSVATVPGFLPASLESPATIYTVVPKSTPFGTSFSAGSGDTLKVTVTGASDGKVYPIVLNPGALTGDNYKVTFDSLGWNLIDVTKGKTLLTHQQNQSGDDLYSSVDGMLLKVTGPPNPGMKGWSIPSGTRRFSPVGGFIGLGLEGFSTSGDPVAYDQDNGTIGMAGHLAFGGIGTTLTDADYVNVLLKLAAVDNVALWNPLTTPADANFSKSYRYMRSSTAAPGQPSFAPWIINKAAGYPYQDFNYGVPFSAWNMETTPPTRLVVGHFENNVSNGLVDGRYWPGLTDVDNSGPREFAFIFKAPYSETADPKFQVNISSNASLPLMWVMTCARRADAAWVTGDQFGIDANHVNSPAVNFTFTAPAPVAASDLATQSVKNITVFPNPYYCINSAETSRFDKWITFTNMPAQATIRIFNLAGQLCVTLQKNDQSTFFRWNLLNAVNYPVASGMYIAYIEVPGVGTKVLKMAIIQEQELLDYY